MAGAGGALGSRAAIICLTTFPRKKSQLLARARFPLRKFPEKFDSLARGLKIAQPDAGEREYSLFPQNRTLEAGCPLFA